MASQMHNKSINLGLLIKNLGLNFKPRIVN